jgi:hypothetical protein
MKYPNILYPGNTKTLKDLRWFGNVIEGYYPEYNFPNTINIKYLNTEEETISKDDNWNYTINNYSFRGDWNLDTNRKQIGFFGCSFTLGQGVKDNETFPSIVEQHYQNVSSLNFGVTGASAQRIAKLISAASKVLNFDVVVITLPSANRLSMIHKAGMLTDLLPYSTEYQPLLKVFDQQDLNMIVSDAVHWINAELKNTNILWSSWCDETYKILCDTIDSDNVLPMFPDNDSKARDNQHPSVTVHKLYAHEIIKRMEKLNWNI